MRVTILMAMSRPVAMSTWFRHRAREYLSKVHRTVMFRGEEIHVLAFRNSQVATFDRPIKFTDDELAKVNIGSILVLYISRVINKMLSELIAR